MTPKCVSCGKSASLCREADSTWYCATCVGLVPCPICGQGGFSVQGLRAHHCRSTDNRRRLTLEEHGRAVQRALASRPGGAR